MSASQAVWPSGGDSTGCCFLSLPLEHLSAHLTISAPEDSMPLSPEKAEADIDHVVRHRCLLPKHHRRENSYTVGVQTGAHLICRSHCHDRLSCSSGPRQPQLPFLLDLILHSPLYPFSPKTHQTLKHQTTKYIKPRCWGSSVFGS